MCLIRFLSVFASITLPSFGLEYAGNGITRVTHVTTKHHIKLNSAAQWFGQLNVELKQLNREAAQYAWESSTLQTQTATVGKIIQLTVRKAHWEQTMCSRGAPYRDFNASCDRALHLLCRSSRNTDEEIKEIAQILGYMQSIYTGTQVCVDKDYETCNGNQLLWGSTFFMRPVVGISSLFDENSICLNGEPDMEKLMTRDALHQFAKHLKCATTEEDILDWLWHSWRSAVGPPIKHAYSKLIDYMNTGARRSGYQDVGDLWRAELEMPNLRETVDRLWFEVKPLYQKFHAVLRYALKKIYPQMENFDAAGLIPAHILGDMWSQNWETHAHSIFPHKINIERDFRKKNWTGEQLVKRAEDFYSSMGLPMMTKSFWEKSIFERNGNVTKCHGTAADMFDNDDYRMIVCAGNSMNDFYVIMHEMGHIVYYMLASSQPTIFQDGTNSAFQESIGDTMHLAALNPLHLIRLGLLDPAHLKPENDENLNSFDYALLLKTALTKIPALPFAYIMDRYRWDLFDGSIDFESDANSYFWDLLKREQGIKPPFKREDRARLFDAAAKYHFPDNTPYVRYFLANFLSFQIVEGLCKKSIFGSVTTRNKLPMALHRCDIYGSKRAGRLLQKALQLGGSQHWTVVLNILTGSERISSEAMFTYFDPLIKFLDNMIKELEIPVGW